MITVGTRAEDGSEDQAIGQLMYDAIHKGRSLYTPAERDAWLARPNTGQEWGKRLAAQFVAVLRDDGNVIGAMTLKADYIDLTYVAPDRQGRGHFRTLFDAVAEEAGRQGHRRLWTHASLMAQPAFLAMGFHVIRHERIAQKGQMLARAEMEKSPL